MVKASAYNAGDLGSIPGLGRSTGEGNGNLLQYFCLKIPWTEKQMCRLILGLHVLFLADINEEKNLPRDF